jgi:hypothetical protein
MCGEFVLCHSFEQIVLENWEIKLRTARTFSCARNTQLLALFDLQLSGLLTSFFPESFVFAEL